ncbi:MAG: hypothetical protein Q9227_008584 [Pyrenula ochraceoflavens]
MYCLHRSAVVVLVTFAFSTITYGEKGYVQDYVGYNKLKYGINPNITFKSTGLVAPLFQVNTWDKKSTDRTPYIFLTPVLNETFQGQSVSPMFVSSEDLSLVWVGQNSSYGEAASNARVQTLHGKNYITFFTGFETGGHGNGSCIFLDENYNLVYNISTYAWPSPADVHECQVTPDNTILITSYVEVFDVDLTSVGGPSKGTLVDGTFQEVVPETGEAIFSWAARDHSPLTQSCSSYQADSSGSGAGGGFGGSGSTSNGNYLVDGRLLHLITEINGTTGDPIWQLGGKFNNFTDLSNGQATNFAWQHHARFRRKDLSQITVFDNHNLNTNANCTARLNCSRGMAINIDYTAHTAKLHQEFYHPQGLQSGAMGSIVPLPNGNHFVGWGMNPTFSEHLPNKLMGAAILNVQFKPWLADVGLGTYIIMSVSVRALDGFFNKIRA